MGLIWSLRREGRRSEGADKNAAAPDKRIEGGKIVDGRDKLPQRLGRDLAHAMEAILVG
jgi:hypothetical protein